MRQQATSTLSLLSLETLVFIIAITFNTKKVVTSPELLKVLINMIGTFPDDAPLK